MAASRAGPVYCQTTSERLAPLNGIVLLLEFEVDESGKTVDKSWEWK